MAEEEDSSQKTEEPTPKRIEDAIRKGNVAFSREVTTFMMLSLFSIFIIFVSPSLFSNAVIETSPYVISFHNLAVIEDGDDAFRLAMQIMSELSWFIVFPFVMAFLGSFLGGFLQNGPIFSPEAISPKLSKVSPLNGLKRIFSIKSVMEVVKAVVKFVVVGGAALAIIYMDIPLIRNLHDMSIAASMGVLFKIIVKILITICLIQAVIAVLDLLFEKNQYMKKLRMTKQEIKDEYKEMEGNPEIKSKIRSLRVQRAKQRIISAIPQADVIITNPTHFAVALKYDPEEMHAPKLIAKGADKLAFKMRELAKEHDVPIVESPPLARSIYENVDWDEFIPIDYYEAVAQVMTKLKKFAKKVKKK